MDKTRVQALIGIGSNENAMVNIRQALEALRHGVVCRLVVTSPFYRTLAVDNHGRRTGGPSYINGAAILETLLDPTALSVLLKEIEAALGRERDRHTSAVAIDLDLVMVRHVSEITAEYTPLRPADVAKPYFLVSAAVVAGDWTIPGARQTIAELAQTIDTQELELVQL